MINKLILSILTIIVCAGTAWATPSEKHDMIHRLDLSRDQVKKIRTIRNASNEQHDALRTQLDAKMFRLHEALSSATPNQREISKITNDISTLKKQLLNHRIKTIQNTHQVLTPSQRKMLNKMRQTRHKHKRQRRHAQ